MNLTQLSANYWVSPQITAGDVREAQQEGFSAIVCNRPDGEAQDQPPAAEIRAACERAGLQFVELPMVGPNCTREMVDRLQQLLAGTDKVLAYCRSGNRSSILYQATQAPS